MVSLVGTNQHNSNDKSAAVHAGDLVLPGLHVCPVLAHLLCRKICGNELHRGYAEQHCDILTQRSVTHLALCEQCAAHGSVKLRICAIDSHAGIEAPRKNLTTSASVASAKQHKHVSKGTHRNDGEAKGSRCLLNSVLSKHGQSKHVVEVALACLLLIQNLCMDNIIRHRGKEQTNKEASVVGTMSHSS